METIPSSGAPSAPPAATPANPVAPASPAPSAPPAAILSGPERTLADYAALARADLARNNTATGPESPPAIVTPPPSAPPETPVASQPTPPTEPTEPDPTLTDEPLPEAQANWTDGERRIYGALRKEREKRKELRDENKDLRSRLETLETRLTTPPSGAAEPAATAPLAPVTTTGSVLAECDTFAKVDARAIQAAEHKRLAFELQPVLSQEGAAPVAERLETLGVKEISGVPVREASVGQLSKFLANVYAGAEQVILAAPQQKEFITRQRESIDRAIEIIPELKDPQSARAKKFVAVVSANPWLRASGANWIETAAKLLLVEEGKPMPAPAKPAANGNGHSAPDKSGAESTQVPKAQVLNQAPGAPVRSPAALPKVDEMTELAAKLANGTATTEEFKQWSRLAVRATAAR